MEVKQRYPITKENAVLTNQTLDGTTLNNQAEVNAAIIAELSEVKGAVDNMAADVSDGLQIVDGAIAVKLADETASENFLDLEDTADGKALAVRKIKATQVVLAAPITVAGVSATIGTGYYKNGVTIPAGTSIEEILNKMFTKESYPSTSSNSASMSASMSAPAINATDAKTGSTLSSGTTVEAGTQIQFGNVSTRQSSASMSAPSVSGFTYGYSSEDDDTKDSSNTSVSGTTSTKKTSDEYSITASFTGFGGEQETLTSTGTGSASVTLPKLTIADGTNRVSVSCKGAQFEGTASAIPSYYIVSNLGNTDANKKSTAVSSVTLTRSTSSSAQYSITGTRYGFYGSSTSEIAATSNAIRNAGFTKTASKSFTLPVKEGTSFLFIIFPSSWGKLTKVINPLMNNSDIAGSFGNPVTVSVEGAYGYKAIDYKMYVFRSDTTLSTNNLQVTIS